MISKQKVFLVHGYDSTPNGSWLPSVMGELKKMAIYACSLDMPTPSLPFAVEWVAEIKRAVDRHAGSPIYLVGHSLGVAGILRYLGSADAAPVSGAVLVSGRSVPSTNTYTAGFYDPFDFETIKQKCGGFVVIHGDDDDVVPYEQGVDLAKSLGVDIVTVKGGRHLSAPQGWTELPQVLDALKSIGLTSERKLDRA